MTKKSDFMVESLRDSRLTPRVISNRPEKAKQHRYERRKARETLKSNEWADHVAG